jgi:RNA polymerase sigma factor (sigma-70 family)
MVLNVARGVTGDEVDAEDVLQDVFISFLSHTNALEDPRCVPGFLRTSATRTSWRMMRRRRRADCQADSMTVEPRASLEDGAIVHDMLSKLAPEQELALVLRHVICHSNEGVARRMGVSVSTARRRVRTGLLALRSMQGGTVASEG